MPEAQALLIKFFASKGYFAHSGNLRPWCGGCRRAALSIGVNAIAIGSAIAMFPFLEILRSPVPIFLSSMFPNSGFQYIELAGNKPCQKLTFE